MYDTLSVAVSVRVRYQHTLLDFQNIAMQNVDNFPGSMTFKRFFFAKLQSDFSSSLYFIPLFFRLHPSQVGQRVVPALRHASPWTTPHVKHRYSHAAGCQLSSTHQPSNCENRKGGWDLYRMRSHLHSCRTVKNKIMCHTTSNNHMV